MIYIDPPYNKDKDFVYPDKWSEGLSSYLEYSKLVDEEGNITSSSAEDKSVKAGRKHSRWLTMMYPRLFLARNLLKEDGVIFISMDDDEFKNLKTICDEIYGEENFIANIVRNTNSSKNQSLFVSVSHEYCLAYAKNIETLQLKHANQKWAVPKNNVDEYVKKVKQLQKEGLSAEEVTEELKTLTKYPRFIDFTNYWYFDDRGLYRKDNLGGVKGGNMEPLFNPITKDNDPVPPGGYRYNTEKLKKLTDENRIHFHTDGSLPTIKRYLHENMEQRPKSIMSDDQRPDYTMMTEFNTPFDNPKQLSFMKRILSLADNDSMILDFFAGSGTTAHAVMALNAQDGGSRKCISVQLPEPTDKKSEAYKAGYKKISEITKERIRRAGKKIKEENPDSSIDTGFKVFSLSESNFKQWDDSIQTKEQLKISFDKYKNNVKEGANQLDMLYEVILAKGLSLNSKVQEVLVGDKKMFQVNSDGVELLACFEDEITQSALDEVISLRPINFICLDSSFKSGSALKTNSVLRFRDADILFETV
jgi:adenine-specific DNA-methyltransferase